MRSTRRMLPTRCGPHISLAYKPSDAACRFFRALSSKLSVLALFCFEEQELRQMHQFLVACDVEEGVRARMPDCFVALKERLGPKCQACFVANPTQASVSQEEVSAILRGIGLSVEDEFRCPKSGYSIDMRVQDRGLERSSSCGCGAGWAVEFDGPSHFFGCKAATGATLIKRRHLELLGYRLVIVPFWEWDRLAGSDERKKYLRAKLHI
jgi:hypothetical protein